MLPRSVSTAAGVGLSVFRTFFEKRSNLAGTVKAVSSAATDSARKVQKSPSAGAPSMITDFPPILRLPVWHAAQFSPTYESFVFPTSFVKPIGSPSLFIAEGGTEIKPKRLMLEGSVNNVCLAGSATSSARNQE